jgi:hypothetical protein
MRIQSLLFEKRYPYASEAKALVAERMTESLSGWNEELARLKTRCFMNLWEVKRLGDGLFEITRDFSLNPENEIDSLIWQSFTQIYGIQFDEGEGKLTSQLKLDRIEGPTGENLKGARGQKCCFGGACVNCPQNRA